LILLSNLDTVLFQKKCVKCVIILGPGVISYHYSSCCSSCYSCCCCFCSWWGNLIKKPQGSVVSNQTGWNLAGLFFK